MKCFVAGLFWLVVVAMPPAWADGPMIFSVGRDGALTWSGAAADSVITLEQAPRPDGPWSAQKNIYSTSAAGRAAASLDGKSLFVRLLQLDIGANEQGYLNLLNSYGIIETIAGNGFGGTDGTNYWQPRFEGALATEVALSRPHFAMADAGGNVFIVDKDSHSVLKVSPDGRIHTVAGTHAPGDNGNGPMPGRATQLSSPNGLWVLPNGTLYVLDTGNAKVRRLSPEGIMTTLFTVSSGINIGRGLWVNEDESLAYFCSGTELRRRVPGTIKTVNNNFIELGNIIVAPGGNVIATDRGDNKVFVVDTTGSNQGGRDRLFGDGTANAVVAGTPALNNGLNGVRGVWPLPNGGYLLAIHEGSRVLYVDAAGILYVLVDGAINMHAGDGHWFHTPGPKISEPRAVSMDNLGNLLIVESDYGYVRRIRFQRLAP